MLTFAHSSYFHDLLGSFSAGVVICNINGLVYAQNASAGEILGVSQQELADPSRSAAIIARTSSPRAVAKFLAAPLKHGKKPEPVSVSYRRPDGELRHLRLAGSLLLENEKIFGILIEITDVTEIVALHERERAMLLGIQAAQLERIESLGHFSLAVAHQIRNPLMIIGGFAGRLLRKKPEGDAEAESLAMILDAAGRLETVVQAVTTFARRRAPQPAIIDPAAVASRAMAAARQRTGLTAELALRADTGPISLDGGLLEEILTELVANALEAGAVQTQGTQPAPGYPITVDFAHREGGLAVTVADRGKGLGADSLPFVFDPFFTTKAVGVGMGLSIARRDAEELGGSLELTPGPQGGCLARLTLPPARPGMAASPGQEPKAAILP